MTPAELLNLATKLQEAVNMIVATAPNEPDPEPEPEPAPEPVWPSAPHVWWDGQVWTLVNGRSGMYRSPVRHTERLHLGHDTLSVVARTFAREAVPVTLVPTEAWEAWLMAVGTTLAEIEDIDGELIDAVDGFAQEVAR